MSCRIQALPDAVVIKESSSSLLVAKLENRRSAGFLIGLMTSANAQGGQTRRTATFTAEQKKRFQSVCARRLIVDPHRPFRESIDRSDKTQRSLRFSTPLARGPDNSRQAAGNRKWVLRRKTAKAPRRD